VPLDRLRREPHTRSPARTRGPYVRIRLLRRISMIGTDHRDSARLQWACTVRYRSGMLRGYRFSARARRCVRRVVNSALRACQESTALTSEAT